MIVLKEPLVHEDYSDNEEQNISSCKELELEYSPHWATMKYSPNIVDTEKILVIINFQFNTLIEKMRGSVRYFMGVTKNLRI